METKQYAVMCDRLIDAYRAINAAVNEVIDAACVEGVDMSGLMMAIHNAAYAQGILMDLIYELEARRVTDGD